MRNRAFFGPGGNSESFAGEGISSLIEILTDKILFKK